jgi:hypothetical protein
MSFAVKVNFTPQFVDAKTISNPMLITNSGNETKLSLKGYSSRFKVSFNTNSINFDEVKLEGTANRVLTITNDSEL